MNLADKVRNHPLVIVGGAFVAGASLSWTVALKIIPYENDRKMADLEGQMQGLRTDKDREIESLENQIQDLQSEVKEKDLSISTLAKASDQRTERENDAANQQTEQERQINPQHDGLELPKQPMQLESVLSTIGLGARPQLLDIIYSQECNDRPKRGHDPCRPNTNRRIVQEAILAFVSIERQQKERIDLTDAILTATILHDVDLSGGNLKRVRFGNADLSGANLSGTDLRGAFLDGANFGDAQFSNAILAKVDLSSADFRNADFTGADLRQAELGNLKGAVMREANICRSRNAKRLTLPQLQDACGCEGTSLGSSNGELVPASWEREECKERWPDGADF